MRHLIFYALMLLLGYACYRYGQNLLRKGYRDETGNPTQGIVGPFGFLLSGAVACYFFFISVKALVQGEVPCVGKTCKVQTYALATHAADYGSNLFFLVWCVLGLTYAMYVTLRIWSKP